MNLKKILCTAALLCAGVPLACVSQSSVRAGTILKSGDRVVFYGDSITEQRLYTRYIQQYIDCRYPDLKIHFYNAGWSGDTAGGALNRLDRDVLILKPTVVTLFFGMNDGGYQAVNPDLTAAYTKNMEGIITALQAKNVRVIVFTPGSVDPEKQQARLGDTHYNDTLAGLAQVAIALAKKHNCTYVDVHDPMLAYRTAERVKDPNFSLTPDGIHPFPYGHMLMTSLMLAGFNVDPLPPLGSVDVAKGSGSGLTVTSNQNGSVTLTETKPSVAPFWFEPSVAATMKDSGFDKFTEQQLVVKGLSKGTYDVTIDGQDAGEYSNTDLAAGVRIPGTYSATGQKIYDMINAKENLYYMNWRNIRLPLDGDANLPAVTSALMDADDQFTNGIYSLASAAPKSVIALNLMPGGPNLALNKPYTVSDPNGYNWGIGGLTDGSWEASAQHCFASGDKDSFPKTATIDLGSTQKVSQVLLGVPAFGATKTVSVSISTDGTNFTDVGSHTFVQKQELRYTYSFPVADARYVRLNYPDHYDDGNGYTNTFVFTTECEVFGGGG